MRKIILVFVMALFSQLNHAQVQKPVKWVFTSKNLGGGKYEIHLTATIASGWHTYAQNTPEGGPVPTAVAFNKNPLVILDGKTTEVGDLKKHNEPLFGVDVYEYANKLDLVQIVKLKTPKAKTTLTGSVTFMVCNNKQCLPPSEESFSIPLK